MFTAYPLESKTVLSNKLSLPTSETALPGRAIEMPVNNVHFVHGRPLQEPFPDHLVKVYLGLGCFWGAERKFWQLEGVYTTAVGYGAGITPNPSYEEVCTGLTGHNELVLVVFDPAAISFTDLLKVFFESHNPTQGMRQGGDQGTQYRSGIYYTDESQKSIAQASLTSYQIALSSAKFPPITTEVIAAPTFYYAEEYHQQYLAKNPQGYCGIGGTGVSCVI
jgi:peptide-methionine (S)-S-oxide reductase